MAFSLEQFYRDLDIQYDTHDLSSIEQFLLRSQAKAYADSLVSVPFDGCPSCIPEAVPNMNYVSVCNELACFYRGLSRFQDSLSAFADAEKELESFYRQETVEYATVLLNKAGTYRYMQDLTAALSLFQKSAHIMEQAGPERVEILSGLYNNIGLVYLDLNDPKQALTFFLKAMSIVEKRPEMITECGSTWNNLAVTYDRLARREDADIAISNAVRILSGLNGGNDSHYPAALNTRGTFAFRSGNYEAALADFTEAAEKTLLIYGKNIEYACACENCAAACEKLGRIQEADSWKARAEACKPTH